MATVNGIVCDAKTKWGLFMDEYQRNFWKLDVAMGFESNFMVLTGDVDQGRDPRGSRTASADVAIYNQINLAGSDEDPLRLPFSCFQIGFSNHRPFNVVSWMNLSVSDLPTSL